MANRRACPHCGKPVGGKMVDCPHCGQRVADPNDVLNALADDVGPAAPVVRSYQGGRSEAAQPPGVGLLHALRYLLGSLIVVIPIYGIAWAVNVSAAKEARAGKLTEALSYYRLTALLPGTDAGFRRDFLRRSMMSDTESHDRVMFAAVDCHWGMRRQFSFEATNVAVKLVLANDSEQPLRLEPKHFIVVSKRGERVWAKLPDSSLKLKPGQATVSVLQFPEVKEDPAVIEYFDGTRFLRAAIPASTDARSQDYKAFAEGLLESAAARLMFEPQPAAPAPAPAPVSVAAAPPPQPTAAAPVLPTAERVAQAEKLLSFALFLDPDNRDALLARGCLARQRPIPAPTETMISDGELTQMLAAQAEAYSGEEANRQNLRMLYYQMILNFTDPEHEDALIALGGWTKASTPEAEIRPLIATIENAPGTTTTAPEAVLRRKAIAAPRLSAAAQQTRLWRVPAP